MAAAMRGALIGRQFVETELPRRFAGRLGEASRDAAWASFRRTARQIRRLGQAPALRSLLDLVVRPIAELLGYRLSAARAAPGGDHLVAVLASTRAPLATLVVVPRDAPIAAWRLRGVQQAAACGLRWAVLANGRRLQVADAARPHARRAIEFDLETTAIDPSSFFVLWGLLRAEALEEDRHGVSLLDRAIEAADAHRAGMCRALRRGVERAAPALATALLARHRAAVPLEAVFDEALTVVYRILFLLFAEARGLVPVWHPVYRESYTIAALADPAYAASPRGCWAALQAVARLAHRGCRAGELVVTPFDGRLFAPRHAPLAASVRIDDRVAASIVGALARSDTGAPLSYADLGVEQLGAVYEQVLDFDPAVEPRGPGVQVILRRGVRRKSSGSFYTPRSITDYLVRRALHPLVERAMPEDVLALRVLDPAMGSGAFLVSACRYLARAYEEALVRSGAAGGGDFSETDRAGFRRLVAQRCLFGVDLNPTAVQLARLSLWLATLSGDRPLTFLDHALRVGNSLVGASPGDAGRRPFDSRRRRSRAGTPLFGPDEEEAGLRPALGVRLALASQPDDTPASVEHKERALAELASDAGPLAGMRAAADLWCAFWFWGEGGPGPAEAGALVDHAAGRPTTLPPARAASMMARGRAVAARERFFHWPLEFPEVFYQAGGLPRPNPGFDAVIGNPPWKMLRGDTGTPEDRRRAREASTRLGRFARQSGLYRLHDGGQGNLYQLFLERSLMLLRTGGRFGLLLPSGLAVDLGSAALRRYLLDRCALDALVSLDNRDGIFPIHRSLRFLLLTGTKGPQTTRLACRMGERSPAALDAIPDAGAPETAFPVSLTPALVRRIGGTDLVIPHLDSPFTAALVEKLAAFPALGSPSGWHARFGRELNATDDRDALSGGTDGLPVVEGKHLAPFSIDLGRCRLRIAEAEAKRRLPRAGFRRERLAYRDVTSSANRWPLIAVVLPAGVVTTHTVYCLRTPLPLEAQHFLCGVLNSFVVNYLVRLEVGTHVTTALVERLPVPRPDGDDPLFRAVASAARRLAVDPGDADAAGRLQGAAAALYRLTDDEWAGVLAGFPHASAAVREGSRRALARLRAGGESAESGR